MSLERMSLSATAAVLSEKKKPVTLVEKLEKERDNYDLIIALANNVITKSAFEECKKSVQNCIAIVKQHHEEVCHWRNNKGTSLWECHYGGDYSTDCGLEWDMSNPDSPTENEMNYCPKCGKRLVEVEPPSEVQDD